MRRSLLGAVALFGVGAALPAWADGSLIGVNALLGPQTPGWFVAPGTAIGIQHLPRWSSNNSVHAPAAIGAPVTSVFSVEPRLFGGEYGGTIGYAFTDGALPAWLGQRVRVGVTGTYFSLSASKNSSGVDPITIGVIDLQGRNAFSFGSAGSTFTESLRVHRHGFDVNLRAASDFPLAPGWTLTPSLGIFGGRTVDTYNFDSSLSVPGFPFFFTNQLDETLRSWSVGGDVAAGLTWQATTALSFTLAGRAGVAYLRSHLDGTECARFVVDCSSASFQHNVVSNSSVSISRSAVGFRGGAALSASLDMRLGVLTAAGFFSYDSATPGVQNPSQVSLLPAGAATGQAVRIRFAGSIRYGGMVNLRIPLLLIP